MDLENKNIPINLVKIAIILGITQAITQYIVVLFFLHNYNKFLIRQFFNVFIQLLKNKFYRKINSCLSFYNKFCRCILINLIELLLKKKKNIYTIKFLFNLLKVSN